MTKLVFISDTHNMLGKMDIPDGDILIHSGDATMQGKIHEIHQFNKDLESLKDKFSRIVFIPGNHDFGFETHPKNARDILTNASDILIDQSVVIDGIKIYGSPWQPWFYNWAFNFNEFDKLSGGTQAQYKWSQIPEDTDILVTHGPPYGILDQVNRTWGLDDNHVGCPWLLKRVEGMNIKIHAFGHIHESYGMLTRGNTQFINASCLDDKYKGINAPVVVEY